MNNEQRIVNNDMKFSSIKTGKDGAVHLHHYTVEQFMKRIQTDANNFLIGFLRSEVSPERVTAFRRYHEIPQISAPVELCRQDNGALGVKAFNGLVVLEVRQLQSSEMCEHVKSAAMEMPTTLAAFTGATGTEVVILVLVARADGGCPHNEMEAEDFYVQAYHRMAQIYDATLPQRVTRMTPTLRHTFLLPLDESPLLNSQATPYRIQGSTTVVADEDSEAHLLVLPEQRSFQEMDMEAYQNYERVFGDVSRRVTAKLSSSVRRNGEWYKSYVTGMATGLFEIGWPEEEAVCHLWRHLTFKDEPGVTEDFVRALVEAVYEEGRAEGPQPKLEKKEPLMQQIIRRIESRYVLRYNTIMGYTEYRSNHTWATPWRPVTEQVINTFTTDLQLAGLDVWNRDVTRYVHSTRIRTYNPIDDYLFHHSKWDGHDYIRDLAATVPTENPAQWAEWFHTWFLAMVAQWQGRDRRYGNSLVPLLISRQGMHKSAFCRSLLPPELRSWGYMDNLSLAEEKPVHLAMAQMLLINLDEFNRISPQKQQGFLKNILQLPSMKVKRPHAKHSEDVPRLASFIATTNMADVLTDPTGSRRFLGVQVTGDIDVSQTPNYAQLYAQAQEELNQGVRYWFDDAETVAIMKHNQRFRQQSTAEQFFLYCFNVLSQDEPGGEWLLVSEILLRIKAQVPSFQIPAANAFGRVLRELPGIVCRRVARGTQFYVQPLK